MKKVLQNLDGICIHPPKTGGTFLTEFLKKKNYNAACDSKDLQHIMLHTHKVFFDKFDDKIVFPGKVLEYENAEKQCPDIIIDHNHAQAARLNDNFIDGFKPVAADLARKKFCFGLVRNPFELLVSYYHCNSTGRKYKGQPSGWNNVRIKHNLDSFEQFIEAFCDMETRWFCDIQKEFYYFQFFDYKGNCLPDRILRTERLNEAIAETFGCSSAEVNQHGMRKKREYQQHYTSKMVDMVEKAFARELKMFDYSFEDKSKNLSPVLYTKENPDKYKIDI